MKKILLAVLAVGVLTLESQYPLSGTPTNQVNSLDEIITQLMPTVPETTAYPTVSQVQAWIDTISKQGPDVSVVGKSRNGHDIHLISFNPQGSKKALFLSYVHANEPVGLPVIQFLCDTLATPDNSIAQAFPDVHFLFVPVLDIDGAMRNEGFYGGTTMTDYLLNHYRPPLIKTPVYSLPFEGQLDSDKVQRTPETVILMKLIETYKPVFINELHCAEFGNGIFWSWERNEHADLADRIKQLIANYYPLPAPDIKIHSMMTAAEKPRSPKGGNTIDYARFFVPDAQVFNLELGLWMNPLKYDTSPSEIDPSQAASYYEDVSKRALAIYNTYWPQIKTDARAHLDDADVQAFYDAFVERTSMKPFTITSAGPLPSPMANADLFRTTGSKMVLRLRNYSLLYGLTKSLNRLGTVEFNFKPVIAQLESLIAQSRLQAEKEYVPGDEFVSIRSIVQVLAGSGLYALATALETDQGANP